MALPPVFKMVKSTAAGAIGCSSTSNDPPKKKNKNEMNKNGKDRRVQNNH